MRRSLFLFALLCVIATVTTALAPFSIAIIVRNRAGAGSRRIVSQTRRRLVAARDVIAQRIRAATT